MNLPKKIAGLTAGQVVIASAGVILLGIVSSAIPFLVREAVESRQNKRSVECQTQARRDAPLDDAEAALQLVRDGLNFQGSRPSEYDPIQRNSWDAARANYIAERDSLEQLISRRGDGAMASFELRSRRQREGVRDCRVLFSIDKISSLPYVVTSGLLLILASFSELALLFVWLGRAKPA